MSIARGSWFVALCMLSMSAAYAQRGRGDGAADCDRRCLLEFLTEYTEALTDNHLSRLEVASDVRVTSNGESASSARVRSGGQAADCRIARHSSIR